MDFKNFLASYNQIKIPKILEVPLEKPLSKFEKLLELYSNRSKKDSKEDNPSDLNKDEYGFLGFTYTGTDKTPVNIPTSNHTTNNSNIELAIEFFKNKGLKKHLISGILGNLLGESLLNPKAINQLERNANLSGYGRGIAQWSNERVQNFKNSMGVSPEEASLDLQLLFAWLEMQQRPALMRALKNSSTIELATDAIYRGFENGSLNSLATPELLTNTYGRAWQKLGYKPYIFQNELNERIKKSQKALSYMS